MESHKGYDLHGFITSRGLDQYNEIHQVDFSEVITQNKFERGVVVDLGCGNGRFLGDLKLKFPHLTTIGVDRKLYQHSFRGFIVGDLRQLPLESGIADLVVSTCVSQWINSDRPEFYKEAMRILKKNGKAFIFPAEPEDIVLAGASQRGLKRQLYGSERSFTQLVV